MKLREHQKEIIKTMQRHTKGQILVPTGGGKTACMIFDAHSHCDDEWAWNNELMKFSEPKTIVVVAPRILLAQQLCEEFLTTLDFKNTIVLHVHSGETHHERTTDIGKIYFWHKNNWKKNRIIFTTYHSLNKVMRSTIDVDTIYFDEAHNSVQKNFIESVEHYSMYAKRCYFFTATPKHSSTPKKVGMNEEDIFGEVIVQIPAPDLISRGYIIPPKVKSVKYPAAMEQPERDKSILVNILKNEDNMEKVLITAKSTRDMSKLLIGTDFPLICEALGYHVMWITSKYGAMIDGKKVSRDKFFDTMNEWGNHPDKKFVMFHHSILSEGMNVHGLTACILMRNLDLITMAQTIGRVIRLHKDDARNISSGDLKPNREMNGYRKPFGKMFVPVYSNVGISTERRLQSVVDTIFNKGEAQVSTVKR